ncbi:ABC transporter substrate-binding protein, partial [Pseudomonas aeruginosa]|uniref:ABC transporter substrate-binding protein n=1 Tax=Pseudomonas aeruginosa TaxID=287 RepID=UPI00396A4101
AAGGQSNLLGVHPTSQHPQALKQLPSVGYQRQLAAEGVLALRPDILIGTEEMGPPPVLKQLEGAGVRVETLSAKPDLEALESNLKKLGDWLGVPQRAEAAELDYRQRLRRQADWIVAAQKSQPAPGVLLVIGNAGGQLLVAGRNTGGDWVLNRAGARNLATHEGYKPISVEALAALDPVAVVIADRSLEGDAARAALLKQNPGLAATRAARDGRLLVLDPTLLVGGLGPRLPDGLAALSAAFYPSAKPLSTEAAH